MGSKPSKLNDEFVPLPRPLHGLAVFSKEAVAQQHVRLDIKKKDYFGTGGSPGFIAKEAHSGSLVFQSITDESNERLRKSIKDDKGCMVAEIKQKAFTMHASTDVFAASNLDQPLFSLRLEDSLKFKSFVAVQNLMQGSGENILSLKGNWRKECEVLMGEHVIAKMLKLVKGHFMVDIAPGVDILFVTIVWYFWTECMYSIDSSMLTASIGTGGAVGAYGGCN
jgi:hypothetical protein